MATNTRRMMVTGIGLVVIVAALLFGGAGMTAYAAQSALPGDTLYGVKTTLEQTRLSMARDASTRAELYLEFAEIRLGEISSLVSEQRYSDISSATKDFETYANKAIAELEVVAQGDPQQAAVLTARISEALSRYARTLTSMLAVLPADVRQQVEQTIQTTAGQSAPAAQASEVEFEGVVETIVQGAWIISGKTVFIHTQTEIKDNIAVGDSVKVHAALNGDGDLVAREIELNSGDDSANSNDNDNANGNENDDNGNANNDNGNDDNGNANDDNGNDDNGNDDNGNSNDDNGNSNDDNGNDDDGGNGNDDNGNSNDDNGNDDDGGNDNEGEDD